MQKLTQVLKRMLRSILFFLCIVGVTASLWALFSAIHIVWSPESLQELWLRLSPETFNQLQVGIEHRAHRPFWGGLFLLMLQIPAVWIFSIPSALLLLGWWYAQRANTKRSSVRRKNQ